MPQVGNIIQYGIGKLVMNTGLSERIHCRSMITERETTAEGPSEFFSVSRVQAEVSRLAWICESSLKRSFQCFSLLQVNLSDFSHLPSASAEDGSNPLGFFSLHKSPSCCIPEVSGQISWEAASSLQVKVTPHHCPLRRRRPEGLHGAHCMGPGSWLFPPFLERLGCQKELFDSHGVFLGFLPRT